jgi:hypothetical protein
MKSQGPILIDVATSGRFESGLLERWGHAVNVCHGPGDDEICPILTNAGCAAVDGAHGIVFELDLDTPQHRAILARYVEVVRPEVPIRIVVTPEQAERYADLLTAVQVWTHQPNVAELDGFSAQVDAADR